MTRGDGEQVVYGMLGLVLIAIVFQAFNLALTLGGLATFYHMYNESR